MNAYAIILVVVTLGGIGVSVWGWRVLKAAQQAGSWPTVDGIIDECKPAAEDYDLLPLIIYSYTVDGENFQRRFEFPSGTHPMPEFVQSYLDKYPQGAAVKVFYNPETPDESTLEPGARGDWMILALGIMMAVGGAASLVVSL
jgi:hypothetical protein